MDDINPDDLISQLKAIPADSNKISRAVQERPELEKEEIKTSLYKILLNLYKIA